jgi:hypothetical protein
MLSLRNGFKLLRLLGKTVVFTNLSHELRILIWRYKSLNEDFLNEV